MTKEIAVIDLKTMDLDSKKLLYQLLDLHNKDCEFCKKKIVVENMGVLFPDVFSCNDILCVIRAHDKIEELGYTIGDSK